ncbi:MAG: addiction module protein [Acidobacteria bacterium]|nr:addiction module protein [Acidobacteriota bacterium]
MVQKLPNPPPGFDQLSVQERLEYLESLWDHIAAKPESVPVPDWHLQLIEERLDQNRTHPQGGRTWDEFRDELRARLRQRKPCR